MYRLLDVGEELQEGDQVFNEGIGWVNMIIPEDYPLFVKEWDAPIRRKMPSHCDGCPNLS
jgi:hypothetical protein